MQALILGDVHLGKSSGLGKTVIGSNQNSRVSDQLNILNWTLERAVFHEAEHIILTGDIFEDTKPSASLITLFISWLKTCQAYDVHVHIIRGNHDFLRSGLISNSTLDIISEVELSNVSVYKDINTIFIGTSAFTMMPFRDRKSFLVDSNANALSLLRDSLVYELAAIPVTYKKIIVGHLAIEGSIPVGDEIDDIANEIFCPLEMFNGYDSVWMGHVHKPQVMSKVPYIAHIGSMDLSNFGENDHKKHIVIINCDSDKNDFISETIPTRALKKISITIPANVTNSTDYVLEKIKEANEDISKSIIKIELSSDSVDVKSVNKSLIEKYLSDNGAYNVSSIVETKKAAVIKKDSKNTINTKMDVKSAIKTYADAHVPADKKKKFLEISFDIYEQFKLESKE